MEYAAIDFEKLNDSQLSVCEVGIVVFNEGKEVELPFHSSYIKPVGELTRNNWAKEHLKHITDEKLLKAPTYDELFPKLQQIIGDKILVVHSKAADLNYIYNLDKHYNKLSKLYSKWADTYEIALSIGLKGDLAEIYYQLFGKTFIGHHKAEDDARACGLIFERLSSEIDIRQFIHEEEYVPSGIKREHSATNGRHTKYGTHNVAPDGLVFNHDMITNSSFFQGKRVALSGMSDADKKIIKTTLKERLGARSSDLKEYTNVLIIDQNKIGPTKRKKAIDYQKSTGLLVITDQYFWQLVQGE